MPTVAAACDYCGQTAFRLVLRLCPLCLMREARWLEEEQDNHHEEEQ